MIAFLEGNLIEKSPTYVVIECNGIGYMVHISLHTYTKIGEKLQCRIYTHLSIKEDAHTLYGFADENERRLFRQLITVSGIGANTARMMLSSLNPDEIQQAIVSADIPLLQTIKGVGNKTAQRIVVELKDKLGKDMPAQDIFAQSHNNIKEEALAALVTLGFNKQAAEKAIQKVVKDGTATTVEGVIKNVLKIL